MRARAHSFIVHVSISKLSTFTEWSVLTHSSLIPELDMAGRGWAESFYQRQVIVVPLFHKYNATGPISQKAVSIGLAVIRPGAGHGFAGKIVDLDTSVQRHESQLTDRDHQEMHGLCPRGYD